jgi:hypothetical protein
MVFFFFFVSHRDFGHLAELKNNYKCEIDFTLDMNSTLKTQQTTQNN